jgi:hypothetical protein
VQTPRSQERVACHTLFREECRVWGMVSCTRQRMNRREQRHVEGRVAADDEHFVGDKHTAQDGQRVVRRAVRWGENHREEASHGNKDQDRHHRGFS